MDIDLETELGAEEGYSAQRLTLYLPNKDKTGLDVSEHERWVQEARKIRSSIGGGSTALPPADGTWINEQNELLWEQTKIIYCYIYPSSFRVKLQELRAFLHRFGRDTSQGEVVVEFDGQFFRIKKFDPATGI